MTGEDFSAKFIDGRSGHPEHEFKLVVAMGVERALSQRGYQLPAATIAQILRAAAALLVTPPPSLTAPKPWWSLKR